jgi:NAD(P)H-flavin reductase
VPAFHARIHYNRRLTPTTRALFVDLDGRGFDFKPGQWAKLGADAAGAKPYSIASTPAEAKAGALQFLIREDGWGLELSRLPRGRDIYLDGPHGRFCLPDEFTDSHALFVAGGTGIAPIRAMLFHALALRRPPRCTVVYSARATNEFAYGRELREAARAGSIRLALTVTRGAHRRWKGGLSRVDRTLLATVVDTPDTHAFVCGPEAFVTDVRAALGALGVKRIRTEEQ